MAKKPDNVRAKENDAGKRPGAVISVDTTGRIQSINLPATQLLKRTEKDLKGLKLESILPDLPPESELVVTRAASADTADSQSEGYVEQAAASSETLAALDQVEDHVIVLDREWRYLFANASVLRSNGLTKADVLGRRYWEVFPEVIGSPIDKAMRRAFDGQGKITLEHRHLRGNQWHQVEIIPTSSTMTVRAWDISGPKRLEALNQRLIRSLDSIQDPILMMDRQMAYTFVNAAAEDFVGKPRQELLGRNVWELSPWLHDTPFGRACDRALKETARFKIEDHYQPRDSWLHVHYFPSPEGFTVQISDITELKQSQEQVTKLIQDQVGAREMRRGFDLMPNPMIMLDGHLRYTYVNAAGLAPNQRTKEEMVGAHMLDLNPELKGSKLELHCKRAFETQAREKFEFQLPPSGRWFQVEAIPWRNQVIIAAVDITLLKESQASVGILTQTLDQAMDAGWNRPTARDTGMSRQERKADD